jgi:amino acid transporter
MEGPAEELVSTTAHGDSGLERRSIGLPHLVFQSLTGLGPAAAVSVGLLVVIPFAGPTLPLFLVVALLICLAVAVCLGQMARHIPSAGGWYAYAAEGLGPEVAFVVGWVTLLLIPAGMMLFLLSIAFVVQDVATSASRGLGWSDSPWWLWVLLASGVMVTLAYRGIRLAMTAGIVLGTVEVVLCAALALTIIGANPGADIAAVLNPANAASPQLDLFFKGLVLSVLVFVGFEGAAPLAEEARDARRTVPRAIVGTTLAIGLFVIVCAYATVIGFGLAGFTDAALASGNPWIELGARYWGVGWVLIFVALVSSLLGVGNAALNGSSRVVYALARNGSLLTALARTHPRFRTPHVAIVLVVSVGLALALVAGSQWDLLTGISVAALAVTLAAMFIYISVCLSTLLYFWRKQRDEFNPLLHVVVPSVAICALILVVYYQFVPLPALPLLWANIAVIGWILLGVVGVLWLRARRPAALEVPAVISTDLPD